MPIVRMPDGQNVMLPDNPTPEELAQIEGLKKTQQTDSLVQMLIKGGKQVLRGAGDATAFVLERGLLGTGQPEPPDAKNAFGGPTGAQFLRKKLDEYLPVEPGLGNAALRGAGGGIPNWRMMIPGAAGSTAAEATKDFGPAAQTAAAMTAGGAAGFAVGPRKAATPLQDAQRDTGVLTGVALDRIGPPTSGQTAANMAEDAATKYFKEAGQNRTGMFTSMVEGEKVRKLDLANVYSAAKKTAESIAKTGRGEQADALMEAANKLLTGDKQTFITDLQQLSLSLKSLKENPPGLNASTGRTIDAKEAAGAVKALETAIEAISPQFKKANEVYGYTSRQIDTAKSGPLGRIADKTPYTADPAALGKVDAVIGGSDPSQITQTMAALKASGADPAAIARALVEKRMGATSLAPGQKTFGLPGRGLEEEISTLIASGGKDPATVRAPLNVADRIAENLKGGDSVKDFATIHPGGINLRAMVKPNAFTRMQESESIRREISKILQGASPQEVERLLQLSMFDPKLRTAITMMGAGVGGVQGSEK